jgi:hypothetical protein
MEANLGLLWFLRTVLFQQWVQSEGMRVDAKLKVDTTETAAFFCDLVEPFILPLSYPD